MQAIGWRVFLNGRHIDTVWFTGYNAEEAKRSLIEHDGYDPRIEVRAPKPITGHMLGDVLGPLRYLGQCSLCFRQFMSTHDRVRRLRNGRLCCMRHTEDDATGTAP